jgi:hypothetical protein
MPILLAIQANIERTLMKPTFSDKCLDNLKLTRPNRLLEGPFHNIQLKEVGKQQKMIYANEKV